ncbi:hypothetical protein V6N13_051799 [Hibiscus sabdariffa]|uniref:Uncharacterized protein n=1 Tax=Hibiscus sabdariffa TaxID=183260 RepID=A0ABR2T4I8_9ROSI
MVNSYGSGNQSLEYQGITSGRPPEGVTEMGALPILERPASPLASKEQQLAKKSRGFDSVVDFGCDPNAAINMETDSIHSERLGEPLNEKSNLHGKETYASMAAKGRSGNGISVLGNDTDSDEVVVLDEDCTVDDSGCGKSSLPEEDPRPVIPGSALNSTIERSNTSLYGPWMLANTRRRGTAKVANSVNPTAANHNYARGSRFAALHVEEAVDVAAGVSELVAGAEVPNSEATLQGQASRGVPAVAAVPRHEIMKNVAYLASNPTRKSKKGAASKDVIGELNVVPVSSEHAASVVPHTVQRGSSSHNAILIVEPGYETNMVSLSRTGKGRGKGLKGPGEIQRKGFKIHRQNEAKSTGSKVPTLWVKEFADQIDVLTANEQDPPDISVNRERLENDMDYSSVDGEVFVDSSLEKSKDGTGVPSQGC